MGSHTIHPIAIKLSEVVVNMPAVGLENKKKLKIVLAGVPGFALSLQEHTPFIPLQRNVHKLL